MDKIINSFEIKPEKIKISQKTKNQWQKLLELIVKNSDAKEAILTEYNKPYLEIIKISKSKKAFFKEGEKIKLCGHYCQNVIENKQFLEVNDATKNSVWQRAPELEFGINSYLGYPIFWPTGEVFGTICLHDTQSRNFRSEIKTELKFSSQLIENSLEILYQNQVNKRLLDYYSDLLNTLPVGIMIENKAGKILKVNKAMEKITGYKKEELLLNTVFDTLVPIDQKKMAKANIKRILAGEVLKHELPSATNNGEERFVRLLEQKINLPNNQAGIISIQSDITDKVKYEKQIKYASYHDSLTDLYNRSYLENKIQILNQQQKFPLAVIMADLNGLKLVNDTYGHNAGDELLKKMANILKITCRKSDIIARWGGDEFIILLPKTDQKEVKKVIKRIKNKLKNTYLNLKNDNKLPLSAALGCGIQNYYYQDFFNILAEAEAQMYKKKLIESKALKNNIVKNILKTLSENSQETPGHSQRMAVLAEKFAKKLNLSEAEINKLLLISKLHDIGKTVIPKNILNKKEELTKSEWEQIKTHPAVGHRILNTTEEFSHISEEILSHHERWDGRGYPRGLKREEIPFLARIINLVDAYEVMTHQTSYQRALTKAEALAEIEENSGTQFDPKLAKLFIELLQE